MKPSERHDTKGKHDYQFIRGNPYRHAQKLGKLIGYFKRSDSLFPWNEEYASRREFKEPIDNSHASIILSVSVDAFICVGGLIASGVGTGPFETTATG